MRLLVPIWLVPIWLVPIWLVPIWLLAFGLTGEARAHRLDEYLQSTLISVEQDQVEVEIRLTPGVAVLPVVMAVIDRDRDGRISADDEREYAERVLREVALESDGQPIRLTVVGRSFPAVEDMRQGLGTILLKLRGERRGGHEMRFVNRHLTGISVYLVNCALPASGGLTIGRPVRDNLQTEIRFEYSFTTGAPVSRATGLPLLPALAFGFGLIGVARLVYARTAANAVRPSS
jgi:hypothetical protein